MYGINNFSIPLTPRELKFEVILNFSLEIGFN